MATKNNIIFLFLHAYTMLVVLKVCVVDKSFSYVDESRY